MDAIRVFWKPGVAAFLVVIRLVGLFLSLKEIEVSEILNTHLIGNDFN